MSRTEELIAKAQQGDREASEALVEENSGLIWSVARRFLGRGTEADDLYQLGCLGFLKAVEGFDLGYGTQFSTYAVPKIAGEIRRFLRDDGAVKVSRSLKEQAATIKAARSRLTGALGREPTIQEISRQTGFTPEEIALRQAISGLPERERMVIQLRYFHGLTQQRVAAVMNVSQVQVSRIEKKAVAMLRELMA